MMDIYVLDSLYRRSSVIDRFESLVWTERFSAWGDFELHIYSTIENKTLLTPGVRLSINESTRVMVVETIEDTIDNEGKQILKVSGRSLESILDNRLGVAFLTSLTTDPTWYIFGPPRQIARQIYQNICNIGLIDAGDIISEVNIDYGVSSVYPADTIPESPTSIGYVMELDTTYVQMKRICDVYDMGFRIIRKPSTSILYFDIYTGSDRTTSQNTLPAVIFSPNLENLKNTTQLTTIANYKNVAYVMSPVGHAVVYGIGVDPTIKGFDRKVLFVRADDITDTTPSIATAKMTQRGLEGLSAHRQFMGFDGEIAQTSQYVYDTDYRLGDIVEIRDVVGTTSRMRVTEQIFVSDSSGDKSYPTLALNAFVTVGSWLGWNYNQVWLDMGATTYWQDQA